MDSIVYKNLMAWRGCEKLYLDTKTSDVFFIFRSEKNEEIEKVPAHKCILSATSPVFGALFYGLHKQDVDIDVVDTSAEAFKEFLQFFYRNQVKLTTENVPDVMVLCKRYRLDDWQSVLNTCNDVCKSTLTLDKMCWGYELANLFQLDELKSFCEEEIGKNAAEIFRSSGFLKCQPNLLRHILQLESLKCNEAIVFDGCIAWAKAECLRKGCNENDAKNLREQLGDLFYEIRFGEMAHEDLQCRYRMYEGLLSVEEFRDITMMITSKEFRPNKFNRNQRQRTFQYISSDKDSIDLVCSRLSTPDALDHVNISFTRLGRLDPRMATTFTSTLKQYLKKLEYFLPTKEEVRYAGIDVQMRIYEKPTEKCEVLISYEKFRCSDSRAINSIELSTPILINAKVKYTIEFVVPYSLNGYITEDFVETIRMEDGALIHFTSETDKFITCLHFIKCGK